MANNFVLEKLGQSTYQLSTPPAPIILRPRPWHILAMRHESIQNFPDIYLVSDKTWRHLQKGFSRQFQRLRLAFRDSPVLLPIAVVAAVGIAAAFPPVGWALTASAIGMTAAKALDAYGDYTLLGKRTEALEQFGEVGADIALLGAGLALGRAGQTIGKAIAGERNIGNAGANLHLIDEIAAAITVAKSAWQH